MENGSWAPTAGKVMRTMLDAMKNISVCEHTVTIKTTMKEQTIRDMEKMAADLLAK